MVQWLFNRGGEPTLPSLKTARHHPRLGKIACAFISSLCLHVHAFAAAASQSSSSAQAEDKTWPVQKYLTEDFTPPVVKTQRHGNSAANSGGVEGRLMFFSPDGPPSVNPDISPLIVDTVGELVWNGPPQHSFGFGVQQYRGEEVLVGWNGTVYPEPIGRGHGVVKIWDKHYEQIAEVSLQGNFLELNASATFPSNIDLHEAVVTANGTLVVTANNVTQADLTSVGGPKSGWVVEAQIYEIDIPTNKVLFAWKSLDHLDAIPLNTSVYPLGSEGFDGKKQNTAWGYIHINSATPYNGGYLISTRYLCSAIAIARSGEVQWILQGRHGGDFQLGPGADFCYQHDIRIVAEQPSRCGNCSAVTLSTHDNHNCPIDNGTVPASGKIIHLDLTSMQATLKRRFIDLPAPTFPTAQGNFQHLHNGKVLVGHGWIPVMEEYSSSGQILSTYQFGETPLRPEGGYLSSPVSAVTLSYRAFKQAWAGCPKTKPKVIARTIGQKSAPRGTLVAISWNGATEVVQWKIYGGIETVSYIATVDKKGFETVATISDVQFVQVKPVLGSDAPRDCGQDVMSELVFVD